MAIALEHLLNRTATSLPKEAVPRNVVNVWLRQDGRCVIEKTHRRVSCGHTVVPFLGQPSAPRCRDVHRCGCSLRRETGVWTNLRRRTTDRYLTGH
jgi:hypothetical protein